MIKQKYPLIILKSYVCAALIAAVVFSPLSLSFVPIALLAWYLYEWWRPVSVMIDLLTQYFIYLAIAILFSYFISPWLAPIVSLPVLILITNSLEKAALKTHFKSTSARRSLTSTFFSSLILAVAVMLIAIFVTSAALIISDLILVIYLLALGTFIYIQFPPKPVQEEQIQLRILAGKDEHTQIALKSLSKVGGSLFIEAKEDWIKVNPVHLSLKNRMAYFKISLTPALSGPLTVKLSAQAIDRWGLMQNNFEIEPIKLLIIPRAKYAVWLAKKYLAGTKPGSLPLLSTVGTTNVLQGLRQGIEYYGNRLYQPGDSLKQIDWKHSFKYNELISKEFTEFHGQPAIVLVNLVAGNAEEADLLAYNVIISALTLGQGGVPTALAAYNREKVIISTGVLSAIHLVTRSMQLIKEITIQADQIRYLNPPDILKLRSNIKRTNQSDSKPTKVLNEMLQLEYKTVKNHAKQNPCTEALNAVMSKVNERFSMVVISKRNHDAEALAFNSYMLTQKGNAVINI